MSKRIVSYSYTIEDIITVEIEDYELSLSEINDLVNEAINKNGPHCIDEFDWNFVDESPKSKAQNPEPIEECWIQTKEGRVATDGTFILYENCPVRVEPYGEWISTKILKEEDKTYGIVDKFVNVNWQSFPHHSGWFNNRFKPFAELKGLEVFGEYALSPAYLVHNEHLIAVVMPTQISEHRKMDDLFQFAEKA